MRRIKLNITFILYNTELHSYQMLVGGNQNWVFHCSTPTHCDNANVWLSQESIHKADSRTKSVQRSQCTMVTLLDTVPWVLPFQSTHIFFHCPNVTAKGNSVCLNLYLDNTHDTDSSYLYFCCPHIVVL